MMELNHAEQMALFEGLMDAEYRKLKPQFPRCRFRKEFFPEGIYLHIQNGRRHCDVEVGTGIHINCCGMSGMAGTMTCIVVAIIRRRTIR